MYSLLAAAFLAVYITNRLYIFVKAQTRNDNRLPHLITAIQPLSALGLILPRTPFHRGSDTTWEERLTLYKNANLKTVVFVPLFHGRDLIYSSSILAYKQCFAVNSPWQKSDMTILAIMGENVITTDGDAWKRHRRIVAPAFNHATYRNVWDTVAGVYADMIKREGWLDAAVTPVTDFNQISHKIALFLIAIVGFNLPMSWYEPPRDENGRMSLQAVIFEVASSIILRGALPRWSYSLGFKKLKTMDEAYSTFEKLMYERIADRDAQLKEIRSMEGATDADVADGIKDIFGRLVNARLSEGKLSLSDEEIIGNCFIFAFAGHETTANTLAMALSMLALNPDKQDWVYNSIVSAVGNRIPTFDDYDALGDVLGCFYEALRLYPAAYALTREATRDTTLAIPRRDHPDIIEQVFIKKGTLVVFDLIGMFYDPQTFSEPESFKPERWTKHANSSSSSDTSITKDTEAGEVSGTSLVSTLDGFIGFSFGPRTCVGHKFAKVEAVAFLTLLLRAWRVEPVLREGETKEEWKTRVLEPKVGISLTVGKVPLKLARRK